MPPFGPPPTTELPATARELLSLADDILSDPPPGLEGRWPVASALLLRQSLEGSLHDLWRAVAPGVELASETAQLLCLGTQIEPRLARRVGFTWSALSRASHHHAYELPPTATELASWFETVDDLRRAVDARIAVGTRAGGGLPPVRRPGSRST
jgi:hypothetical protein